MRVNFFFGRESKVCIFNFSQLRLISKVTMLIGTVFYSTMKIGRRIEGEDWPIRLLRTRDENMIDTRVHLRRWFTVWTLSYKILHNICKILLRIVSFLFGNFKHGWYKRRAMFPLIEARERERERESKSKKKWTTNSVYGSSNREIKARKIPFYRPRTKQRAHGAYNNTQRRKG